MIALTALEEILVPLEVLEAIARPRPRGKAIEEAALVLVEDDKSYGSYGVRPQFS
tara:strand:+ start:7694 stop:7858 length:165 start_codon:yes stop_codon:yes gene_type:complete